MELTKQQTAQMKIKNNGLMTLVALRHMMEASLFDMQFGNAANWRVLYHNTLDAYLMMPGSPSPDVVGFVRDAALRSHTVFMDALTQVIAPVDVPPITVNVVLRPGLSTEDIAQAIADRIATTVPDRPFTLNVDTVGAD